MAQPFSDMVAIVTGSSSGIGETIAVKLAEQGCSVVVCGRDEQRTKDVLQKCVSAGGGLSERFLSFCGDLNTKDMRKQLVESTVAKYSRLDILIANSGVMTSFTVEEETEDSYDFVMDSNLKSVYFLIQESLPYLEKTKGSIVCVSSVLGTKTLPNRVVYQMSKAGLEHMVRSLALSQGPKGIRVNSLAPGVVVTRLYREVQGHDDDARVKGAASKTPLEGRISTTEEQADVAVFLAGKSSRFVTGQCIKVDGGFTLT